jgi:hypothetical protein
MRRGLCAAAAAVVVALSTAPLFVARADAQNSTTVTASPLTLAPAPNSAGDVATNNLSVSGHFHVAGGLQPTFDWVSVNLSWRGKAPGPPVPGPYTICGTPPSGTPPAGPACTGADEDFKNSPLAPAPAYNGPYRVNATGKATDRFGQSDTQSTNNIDFAIAAPPPFVTGVTATVDSKTRNVTVSWDRDAATPDVQTYWIYRKGPGETDFHPRFQVKQSSSGARLSSDPDTAPASRGGDYLYQVETHRNGDTGDSTSFVVSDRTKSQSNKVTVANPPPGATTVPPPPPSSDGTPPVVKGTPSGVTRNSGFSSSGSSSNTTPTSEAVTPDPGFERGLPYAAGSPAPDNSNSSNEGDNSAVAVTPGRHKSNSRGIFVPVAAGALLFVGAFHLRILKKRLDEPPSTGLTAV